MRTERVLDLVIGRDLLSVTHSDGTELHFTRQERALLLRLTSNAGRLMPREALVAAISGEDAEAASDRHVDFLVNQLRRKLRDDVRSPRFIRTQYGEGYVWIGGIAASDGAPPLLRVGNVYGEHLSGAGALVRQLDAALQQRLSQAPAVQVRTGYTLDASFHDGADQLRAALVLRHAGTSAILATFRLLFGSQSLAAAIAAVADDIVHAIWSSAAMPDTGAQAAPSEPPPWVRMFEAALMMDGDMLTWKSNAQRLAAITADDPANPVVEVMRGLNLYTWLIQSFYDPSGQIVDQVQWRAVEDDIEAIALASLPRFDDQPIMRLSVAKLLLFINRGYLHLARGIADDLLANSTAHAAAFALAGEAAGFAGDAALGNALINRALEHSQAGSHFQLYLLVVQASALLAANEMAEFGRVCRLTRDVSLEAYGTLQAFCCLPGYETSPLFQFVIARDADRAREAIRFLWYVTGRRYAHRDHRRNFMRPLTTALVGIYGTEVIPAEVALGTGLDAELAAVSG